MAFNARIWHGLGRIQIQKGRENKGLRGLLCPEMPPFWIKKFDSKHLF